MSQITVERPAAQATSSPALWRIAGGLSLGHIVLMLGAFALEQVAVEHGTSAASVLKDYAGVSVRQVELASYLEAMAFVVLMPALVLLARLFTARTETSRVAAGTFLGLGVAYVASTLAVGFPPLTASVYAAHHGVPASTIATVNDLRNYGFILQVALTAALALALGVTAIAARLHRRWVGWGGVAVGSIGLVATPFANNAVSMVWMIWWVGMAVLCLRGAPGNWEPRDS
jgi:hypothetical protein